MSKALSEQIKDYIKKSEMSLYRLSLESGVGLRVLTKFFNEGSDMKVSNLDKITNTLNLELVKRKK